MKFEELTPKQQEKARACKTPEDILALAKEEGYELSEEELDGIAGGAIGTIPAVAKTALLLPRSDRRS